MVWTGSVWEEPGRGISLSELGLRRAVLCEAKPLFCADPEFALWSVVAPHWTSGRPGCVADSVLEEAG